MVLRTNRARLASWFWTVVAAAAAVALCLAGCTTNTPAAGPGVGGGTGQGGGAGDSTAGSAGSVGTGTGGAGGGGGAAGQAQPGCPLPAVPAGTWGEVSPPSGQDGFRATDAFAIGTDDLLFAGSTFDAGGTPSSPRVLRWTNGCWTVELGIPASTTPAFRPSVHGTGPNDLWASAGDVLFHRDGQGWSRLADESWRSQARLPPTFTSPIEFRRVRAVAPATLWVAASNNILRWNGQAWTAYNFDSPGYPNESASIGFGYLDIWIDGGSDVWVVGGSDEVGNTMDQAFVHHFDGAGWSRMPVGLGVVETIWRGGSILWLANPTLDTVNGQTQVLTMRRFDGTTAPAVTMMGVNPDHPVAMTSLFGRGPADVWAAGDDVAHFDGQSWSLVVDAPAGSRGADEHNTLVSGDAGSVWLATPGPRFFRKVAGP